MSNLPIRRQREPVRRAFQRVFSATIFFGTDNHRERAAVIHESPFNFESEARIWYSPGSRLPAGIRFAPASRRYCDPPWRMPNVSSIVAALGKNDRLAPLPDGESREENRDQSILTPRQTVPRVARHRQQEIAVATLGATASRQVAD